MKPSVMYDDGAIEFDFDEENDHVVSISLAPDSLGYSGIVNGVASYGVLKFDGSLPEAIFDALKRMVEK